MSAYRLPLPIPTHPSGWQRALQRLQEAWSERRRRVAASDAVLSDWYALRDLPQSLQRDIGVPEALREHGRQLRERDALWIQI